MNNKLLVKMEHLPERVPEGFSPGNTHAWGKLEFCLLKENGNEKCLLSVEWHMRHFINWFIDFHYPRVYEVLMDKRIDESISAFVVRVGSEIAEKTYSERAKFRNFVKSHSMIYAFPNIPMPNMFIGYSRASGEVSLDSKEVTKPYIGDVWFYKRQWELFFDIDHYIYSALVEIEHFVRRWQVESGTQVEDYKLQTLEKLEKRKQDQMKFAKLDLGTLISELRNNKT